MSMQAAQSQVSEELYTELLGVTTSDEADRYLVRLILAAREGRGCLPLHLGLGERGFEALIERSFSEMQRWFILHTKVPAAVVERSDTRSELLSLRLDEQQELTVLLESWRNPDVDPVLSVIIATGCLGGDHLWRDLGFENRDWLSEMMAFAYPQLKAKNSKDMKWKRFLYKQLCETGGNYVCRAPSCEECAVYSDCFGPEA
ncbi:nitrogen fixation protein NifQ [uncultured Amphritea sp.]|uniref:nitrogen fixation protein NifQ n=1 Tax=uncultured Amphritea sp. TaxID=981605 RepID=UPI002604F67C|nr:nitrogen fixation protein NifQ [uncultured Amphritea sp.]